jgi:hypothetical protein
MDMGRLRDPLLQSSYQRLVDLCIADAANHCTVLQSDVSSGQFFSGLIKLRIDPEAVGNLIADAWLAALAIESGCEWITTDGDFANFNELECRAPWRALGSLGCVD